MGESHSQVFFTQNETLKRATKSEPDILIGYDVLLTQLFNCANDQSISSVVQTQSLSL
jgi:hypothetical protein